jgi:hypothetical protein
MVFVAMSRSSISSDNLIRHSDGGPREVDEVAHVSMMHKPVPASKGGNTLHARAAQHRSPSTVHSAGPQSQ